MIDSWSSIVDWKKAHNQQIELCITVHLLLLFFCCSCCSKWSERVISHGSLHDRAHLFDEAKFKRPFFYTTLILQYDYFEFAIIPIKSAWNAHVVFKSIYKINDTSFVTQRQIRSVNSCYTFRSAPNEYTWNYYTLFRISICHELAQRICKLLNMSSFSCNLVYRSEKIISKSFTAIDTRRGRRTCGNHMQSTKWSAKAKNPLVWVACKLHKSIMIIDMYKTNDGVISIWLIYFRLKNGSPLIQDASVMVTSEGSVLITHASMTVWLIRCH